MMSALQFPPTNWPGGRYSFLLAVLALMFAVDPLVTNAFAARVVLDGFMVLVLLSAAMALGNRRIALTIALCIMAPELVGIAVGWLVDAKGSLGGGPGGTLRAVAAVVFFAYMAGIIFADIVRTERVSADTICGAMCVYLMLGLLWAFAYLLIAHMSPNSFEMGDKLIAVTSAADAGEAFSLMTYFSFVTLTTLGYGDVTPVSPIARTACWMEAITGQLFLATFLAGLVGVHIADRIQRQGIPKR